MGCESLLDFKKDLRIICLFVFDSTACVLANWLQQYLLVACLPFQGVEESTLHVAPNAGPEIAETANVDGTVSPSSNVQLASAAVAPSTSVTAENASTLASLRMVYYLISTRHSPQRQKKGTELII